MGASDWYERRFQNRAPQYAPQQQQPQQRPYQQPYQQPQPPPRQPPPGAVNTENLWQMMHLWKGGKAHQVDAQPCPSCGGNQFYSRTDGARRGPPPAPHCYNCGYNGMFEQGLPSTWEAS